MKTSIILLTFLFCILLNVSGQDTRIFKGEFKIKNKTYHKYDNEYGGCEYINISDRALVDKQIDKTTKRILKHEFDRIEIKNYLEPFKKIIIGELQKSGYSIKNNRIFFMISISKSGTIMSIMPLLSKTYRDLSLSTIEIIEEQIKKIKINQKDIFLDAKSTYYSTLFFVDY